MNDNQALRITGRDLRHMSFEELNQLCASLRRFIIKSVSQTGGHLASNLGIVELSVALERSFDSSRDRLIYDVGHQSYVHKILTGRGKQFSTLRRYGGLSGFMKPEESVTDPCVTGHASNSVSVALGMAHARTLTRQNYSVVAVIGDGALTGGMAYEALNDAGASGEPLLVILNDNNMAIAQNVGGLSRHLSRLRVSQSYLNAKTHVKERLSSFPSGEAAAQLISRSKRRLKHLLLPSSFFEQMGFIYLGPVDGHDVKSLCELLEQAKSIRKPVLLHVITKKGRGYLPSERQPEKYHGVSPFDPTSGLPCAQPVKDFSFCFGKTLCELAEKNKRVCAITAAMPSGTGLAPFALRFPDRFFDVGIAEEHAVAMAAGMATQGLLPVVAIYSTFLQRAYDQIIHDVGIAGLHVVFGVDRAGIVGADGATHNGVFDIAFLRSIPGVKIFCPANFAELRRMLSKAILQETGPVAIRYPRGGQSAFSQDTSSLAAVCVRVCPEPDVTIISYGALITEALDAAERLAEQDISVQVWKLNELGDNLSETMKEIAVKSAKWCIVLEDVVQNGSVGECLAACQATRVSMLNIGNRFLPHGGVSELHQFCGLDSESVANYVIQQIEKKPLKNLKKKKRKEGRAWLKKG